MKGEGIDWHCGMDPVAYCFTQNAEEESGAVTPAFSTPELAVLTPTESKALDFGTVLFRGLSKALPNSERKKQW